MFRLGRLHVFIHPSLYRVFKLTFPGDIGGLSLDGSINTEMEQTIIVLTPAMYNADKQPIMYLWIAGVNTRVLRSGSRGV